MIKIIILVIISEIFTAVGQVLFKKSANTLDTYDLYDRSARVKFLRSILSKPNIWLGIFSMAIGLAVWIVALANGDLSIVFPIGSLQYVLILFSAHMFLGEKIDKMKALGTFLVVLGIVFITIS